MDINNNTFFDVIIIGGSYAGLAAGLTLGRSMRKVLIVDSGEPCNRQTPRSHNFITQDGEQPAVIATRALEQVLQYPTVTFLQDEVVTAQQQQPHFSISTAKGQFFTAHKLLFATGIKDLLPSIEGLAECWGISVLHCPYCHGYEIRGAHTGILSSDEHTFLFAKTIQHWTRHLTVFTNGATPLHEEEAQLLQQKNITVVEAPIEKVVHRNGQLTHLLTNEGRLYNLEALYLRAPFEQHCKLPEAMGCQLTDKGFIYVDDEWQTTVPGVYAAGDNTSRLRAVANAVAEGTKTGILINKALIDDTFNVPQAVAVW